MERKMEKGEIEKSSRNPSKEFACAEYYILKGLQIKG
jgi:hypothetical protein